MSVMVAITRATRVKLNALAATRGLSAGQLYLLTDESRIAVATATNAFETSAKVSELSASGSCTVSISGSGGAFTTVTYSAQTMQYTKIGNRVFWSLYLNASGVTGGGGTFMITGLPFPAVVANAFEYGSAVQCDLGAVSTDKYAKPRYINGQAYMLLVLTNLAAISTANIVTATGITMVAQGNYPC